MYSWLKCFIDGQPSVDDDLQNGRGLFIMKRLPLVLFKRKLNDDKTIHM
jgi:hypothetical protein